MTVPAYAAFAADTPLRPHRIHRREPGPSDVVIDLRYCGVCHSDLHTVRGEWGRTTYPCVPGHEMIGRVAAVGDDVTAFVVGDTVGVGCMVGSCGTCAPCARSLEQYCAQGTTYTYDSPDPISGGVTLGGYSARITVDEHFVLRIPDGLDPAAAAPLLCAGITTYSPLRHWRAGPGTTVGVVGLGGLGHMAIKIARAMGAQVILFTTSPGKAEDARRLGASEVVLTTDAAAMKQHRGRVDLILNTVSAPHDLSPFLAQLALDGTMTMLGVPPTPHPSPAVGTLISGRRSLAGSLIGGIAETQEMLDFCARHGIVSDIEMIPIQSIDEAYDRMVRGDVRYRFVIDLATLEA